MKIPLLAMIGICTVLIFVGIGVLGTAVQNWKTKDQQTELRVDVLAKRNEFTVFKAPELPGYTCIYVGRARRAVLECVLDKH